MVIPSENIQSAWAKLFRTQTLLQQSIEAKLKVAKLPPMAWYDVLWELEKTTECGIRAFELQPKLLLPQYGMSRLIARMEDKGLIDRHECPEDGRGIALSITEQGRKVRGEMWVIYGPAMQEAFGKKISDSEAETLTTILSKLKA